MIPKIIHYCWFGGKPLPALAEKCLKSWKKYCPDYEIKRWDETNFDIHICRYVKEAYETKKYAFVTDFVRLWALIKFGGIYMDTDVEVIKPLDSILNYHAISGFEDEHSIPTGLMGAEPNFPLFQEFLQQYNDIPFVLANKTYDMTTNVVRITNTCMKYGLRRDNTLQTIQGFTVFPKDYFCPKSYVTRKLNITSNTLTIHHFAGSWCEVDLRKEIYLFMSRVLGIKNALFIKKQWDKIKPY